MRYTIEAEPSPGLLPRVLQPFAKRDLTTDGFSAMPWRDNLFIEVILSLPPEIVHLIEGNLRQIVGVRSVSSEPDPLIEDD